jgi:flagellar hook-associated protein 3 FlgL
MRIASLEVSRSILSDIGTLNDDLARIGRQLSSGKLLNQLKDSPAGSAALVSLADTESEVDQYLFNSDANMVYMSAADSALNEVNNLVSSIYSLGSQSVSEIISQDSRKAMAAEIRSLRDQIVSLANTHVRDRYIFAGSRVAEIPFTMEGDVVTYNGDAVISQVQVDKGFKMSMNFAGNAVFEKVFSAVNSTLSAIDAGDIEGIQTSLGSFSAAFSDLASARGQAGSGMNTLENVRSRLESQVTTLKAQRSGIEDADMVQASIQLKQTQTALDAAMSAGGSILTQRNLFDILG